MTERRYTDEEVAAIFERATEAQHATPRQVAASCGMTLHDARCTRYPADRVIARRLGALLVAGWLAASVLVAVACAPRAERAIDVALQPQANPHAADSIGAVREIYDGVLSPELAITTFRNIDRLFPTRRVLRSANPLALPAAPTPLGPVVTTFRGKDYSLDEVLELNRVAALLVLKNGQIAMERHRFDNTEHTRWMSMSIAKSITSTLIGAAVKQGRIASLTDSVTKYVPSLAGSAYDGATVRDVLMMSSGAKWSETYTDPMSDRRRLLEAQIAQLPGAAMEVMKSLPRAAEPGTRNNYNTGETQVAAEILTRAAGMSLSDYLYDRIWSKVGMESDATWWLDSPGGVEIGGSGFSATLRDYGRFGLFMMHGGIVPGDTILPSGWLAEATHPTQLRGGKSLDYGYLWWTGTSKEDRADFAFGAEGIHGQFVYVNPAESVVIVVLSARPTPSGGAVVDEWALFRAITDALK